MIAPGITGRNYQRWLIPYLIASFNLFTFGAEQCQPAAVESDLLQGHVTYVIPGLQRVCTYGHVINGENQLSLKNYTE